MTPAAAQLLITAGALYAGLGVVFGLWFVAFGVGRVDPAAQGASKGFRLVILPGVALLWPLFALRLVRGVSRPPEERTAHRRAAARGGGP